MLLVGFLGLHWVFVAFCSTFSGCSEQGLLSGYVCGLLTVVAPLAGAGLGALASLVAVCGLSGDTRALGSGARELRHAGSVALWHVGSSVSPALAANFFNHRTTREVSAVWF